MYPCPYRWTVTARCLEGDMKERCDSKSRGVDDGRDSRPISSQRSASLLGPALSRVIRVYSESVICVAGGELNIALPHGQQLLVPHALHRQELRYRQRNVDVELQRSRLEVAFQIAQTRTEGHGPPHVGDTVVIIVSSSESRVNKTEESHVRHSIEKPVKFGTFVR